MLLAFTLVSGCAWIQRQDVIATERVLAAAGFRMRFADTPERRQDIDDLPQRKLVHQNRAGKPVFVYADELQCQCIYVGDEEAYQRYQKLAIQGVCWTGRSLRDCENGCSGSR